MDAALKEAREERDICVSEKEREVREEMEKKVEEMVRQEQERGAVRLVKPSLCLRLSNCRV